MDHSRGMSENPIPRAGPFVSVRHITPETKRTLEQSWAEQRKDQEQFDRENTGDDLWNGNYHWHHDAAEIQRRMPNGEDWLFTREGIAKEMNRLSEGWRRTEIALDVFKAHLMALEFQRNALATALRKMLEETTGAADPGDVILAILATIRKQIEACPKMETAVKIMQENAMKDLTVGELMDAISEWFSYAEAPD